MIPLKSGQNVQLALGNRIVQVSAKCHGLGNRPGWYFSEQFAKWHVRMTFQDRSKLFVYYVSEYDPNATSHIDFADFADCLVKDARVSEGNYSDFTRSVDTSLIDSRTAYNDCREVRNRLHRVFSLRLGDFYTLAENKGWVKV